MRPFYEKNYTLKDRKDLRKTLKTMGVRVHFIKGRVCLAEYENSLIKIGVDRKSRTLQDFLSDIFHELGHIYCYQNDLYKIYHNDSLPKKELAIYMRKYGLRAERFVDSVGKKLMSDYFPDIPYIPCYQTPTSLKWYKKWINRNYPL